MNKGLALVQQLMLLLCRRSWGLYALLLGLSDCRTFPSFWRKPVILSDFKS